jgi:hypothetical protein
MHPRTAVLLLAVLIGIPAALIAWRNTRLARGAETALVIATEKRTEAEAGLQQAKVRLEKARSALEKLQAAEAAIVDAPKKLPRTTDPDTTLQALQLAAEKAKLRTSYTPLFGKLALTDEQIARFMDIVARREEQHLDVAGIIKSRGLTASDPIASRLRNEAQSEFKAAQRELLGEIGFKELEEFERSKYARNLVSDLVGIATIRGAPLTTQQAERLVQAVAAAERPRHPTMKVDWEAVDQQARSVLDEAQWIIWKTSDPSFSNGPLSQRLAAAFSRARTAELQRESAAAAP